MATPLNISLKVTGLDQAKAELQTLGTIGQRSFAQLEAQAQRLSARMQQTESTLTAAALRVLQLTRAVDTAAAANLSYRDSLVAINTAFREGWITAARQTQLTQALREEQQQLRTQIRAVTDDIRQLGRIGTQGFNTILSSATTAASGVRPTGAAVLTLAQNMRTLVAELNPAAAANQKLAQTIRDVRIAANMPGALITRKEETAIIAQLRAEFDKTATSIRTVKNEIRELNSMRGLSSGDIQARVATNTGTPKRGSTEQLALANEMLALSKAADTEATANLRLSATLDRVRQAVAGTVISQQNADRIERHLIETHNALNTSIARTAHSIAELATIGERSYRSLDAQATRLARTNQETAQSYDALLKRVQANIAAVNPMASANQKLRDSIREVRVAQSRGDVDHAQAEDSINKMTKAHERWVAQQKAGMPTLNQSTLSTKQLGNVVTQFSFQMNDIATGLASGVSPFTILAQQGGQVIQVFQGLGPGGVTAVLAGFGTMLMKLLNPTTLFIAGIVGIGVAIGALVARALAADAAMRQFSVSLDAMNKTALASPAGLENVATSLADVGVSAADARKEIASIIQAGINPKFSEAIIRAGANLQAGFGGNQMEDIKKAFAGGSLAAIDYGVKVRAVSLDQAAFLRQVALTGDHGKVLETVLAAITEKSKGWSRELLGPLGQALRDLNVNWQALMDRMSKSEGIQKAVTGINDLILLVERLFSADPPKWFKVLFLDGMPGVGEVATALGSQRVKDWLDPSGTVLPGGTPSMVRGAVNSLPPGGMSGLDPKFQTDLRDLIAKASEQGLTIGIGSGFRTFEHQSRLFSEAVAKYGSAEVARKYVAPPGGSQHEFGRAADLVDASGRAIRPGTAEDQFLRANATMFDLQRRMGHEPWHVEPIATADSTTTSALTRPAVPGVVSLSAAGPDAQPENVNKINALLEAERRRIESEKGIGFVLTENQAKERAATLALENGIGKSGEAAIATALLTNAKIALSHEIENLNTTTNAEIKGQQYLVAGYKESAAEGKTREAIFKAQTEALTRFGRIDTAQAQAFIGNRAAQNVALEKFSEKLKDAQEQLVGKDTINVLQLQKTLVGETSEETARQVTILTEKQRIEREFPLLSAEEKAAKLGVTEEIAKQTKLLADMQREQSRVDDIYRKIGSTIESTIGSVIDGIFDPKKAMDWGKAVKDMATGLFKDISMSFVRPMIGNLLGAFGASNNVIQGFGGNTSGGGTNISIGGGMFGGGLFKELGIDTGSLFSGTNSFFNKSVGGVFGTQQSGWIEGAGGVWTNAATGATTDIAGVSNITPGFLGNTTLGTAIGSVGLGFTAGSMLNSVLGPSIGGGKSTGGMIGSGVGSLAGMALGSMVGMPWLGALLGGAGGGLLGGMFGNSKPSNASSGANFDLSSFKLTSGFSGGNSQIDQQVQQLGQGMQGFLELLKTTGGKLSGNVLLQSGVNTGITVDSSLEGYAGRFSLGKDTDAALKVIEQALVKSITGVSDTMKTVLSQVGTDEDIAKAIQFAKAYDDIKTAAESAFSSVEDATKRIGPFGTAMNEINALFTDLTTQATRFGLSLEPLNAGLAEATSRLQGDFINTIEEGINAASGDAFINSLSDTIDGYLAAAGEAARIGLPGNTQGVGDLLGTEFMAEINNVLKDLSPEELVKTITYFQGIVTDQAKVVTDLAVTMLNTTKATTDLTDAQERLAAALNNIQAYIDKLVATSSFAVSPETALAESQTQYATQLALAQGGDLVALEGITDTADQLLKAIQDYYGSSEAGVNMFDQVVSDLRGLVGIKEAKDPVVVTNEILTTLVTETKTLTGDVQALTGVNSTGFKSVADYNNEAAAALIAQNKADAQKLIDAGKTASDAAIADNLKATDALVKAAQDGTSQTVGELEASRLKMVESNKSTADALVAQSVAVSTEAMQKATDTTAAIIAQNDASKDALIENNSIVAAALTAENTKLSDAQIDKAQTTTDALIDQSLSDVAALKLATETSTGAINEQAKLEAEAALLKAGEDTAALKLATENAAALQIDKNASETKLITDANKLASDAITAKADEQTKLILDGLGLQSTTLVQSDGLTRDQIITSSTGITASLIDTIATWGGALHTAIYETAGNIAAIGGSWSKLIIDTLSVWSEATVNTIAVWSKAQMEQDVAYANAGITSNAAYGSNTITAVYDGAEAIVNTIAAWTTAHMTQDAAWDSAIINSNAAYDTNTANTVVNAATAQINTVAAWVQAQMNNDTALSNNEIRVLGDVYGAANLTATYGAASSIIDGNRGFSNGIVAAIGNWGQNQYNLLSDISSHTNSLYVASVASFNNTYSQLADVIQHLQSILDQLRLAGNAPYPPSYNTGGV